MDTGTAGELQMGRDNRERKLIIGILHKKVPCVRCRGMIWIQARFQKSFAWCSECRGDISSNKLGVGRDKKEPQE